MCMIFIIYFAFNIFNIIILCFIIISKIQDMAIKNTFGFENLKEFGKLK